MDAVESWRHLSNVLIDKIGKLLKSFRQLISFFQLDFLPIRYCSNMNPGPRTQAVENCSAGLWLLKRLHWIEVTPRVREH